MGKAPQGRRSPLSPSWLEADGRLLSPSALQLRFLLVVAAIALAEVWRQEGVMFGLAVLLNGQLYHLAVLQRIRATLKGERRQEDPRPLDLVKGWMELDGDLLGATPATFRAAIAVALSFAVVALDPTNGIAAILFAYLSTEALSVFLGRTVDALIQIEVKRRMALERGEPLNDAWRRGDYRDL